MLRTVASLGTFGCHDRPFFVINVLATYNSCTTCAWCTNCYQLGLQPRGFKAHHNWPQPKKQLLFWVGGWEKMNPQFRKKFLYKTLSITPPKKNFFKKPNSGKNPKSKLIPRMLPDLARFGGQFPRSGSFSRCGDLVSRSGQIWPDLGIWENFFFKKKKKPPRSGQIWKSGQFFFFLRFLAIVSQGKGLSNFFFRPYIGLISTI